MVIRRRAAGAWVRFVFFLPSFKRAAALTAATPDFQLADLNLPERKGFEVLRSLRASEKMEEDSSADHDFVGFAAGSEAGRGSGSLYFRMPPNYDEFLKLGAALKQLLKTGQ